MKKQFLFLLLSSVLFITGRSQSNSDFFDIYFSHDYEENTIGTYNYGEWQNDWYHPAWNNRVDQTFIRLNTDDTVNPTKVMRWVYPEGTYRVNECGGQFEAKYGHELEEAYFSFDVRFKPGFEWVISGKLPGVKGGESPGAGNYSEFHHGFTASLFWNSVGNLYFYTYHHDRTQPYGDGVAFNNFQFDVDSGRWYNITMRVVLNTIGDSIGHNNGILEGYVDGKLYAQRTNLRFRNLDSIKIDKLKIYSAFGGSGDRYRTIRDEWIETDNYVVFTYKDNVDVPRGQQRSPRDRVLILPDIGSESNIPAPFTPGNLQANALSHNSLELTWNRSEYVAHYIIESSTNEEGPYTRIATVSENSTSFVNTGLTSNSTYYYRIKATNAIGQSDYSNIASATTNVDPVTLKPASPDNLTAALNENSIQLVWNDNSDNESGFRLEYSLNQATSFSLLEDLNRNSETYNYNCNENDSLIIFRICAENQYGQSSYTEVVCRRNTNQTLDVNNEPVILPQSFEVRMDNLQGIQIGNIIATDPDNQLITFSIKSDNSNLFDINPLSGQISFKEPNDINIFAEKSYELEIEVTDNGIEPLSNSATVTVHIIPKQNYVFIDPANNDPLEDGSYEHPYNSWQDVTWMNGMHYAQKRGTSVTEDKILVTADDITIEAYDYGEYPVLKSTADDYALKFYEKSNITIKDIEINAPDAISCVYFMGGISDNNTIENCRLSGSEYGLRIIEGKNYHIRYNVFENKTDGIYSIAEKNYIHYNVFKNNQIAINIVSVLSEAEVYNNVFYGNMRGVSTSYASLKIYNNIFYLLNSGDEAINHSLDNLISDHNIFYPEQDGFININSKSYSNLSEVQQDMNIDLNSLINDPLFVDIYNENFTLQKQSPAVNKGLDLGLNKDFFGYNVPYGNNPDIGLIELQNIDLFTSAGESTMNAISFNVSPNPTSGNLKIKINDLNNQNTKLMIQDASGKIIYNYEFIPDYSNDELNVDISAYPAGVYYASIKNSSKDLVEKIIKL